MKDYVGQWFEIYRRHHEPCDIGFEIKTAARSEKVLFPHEKADGTGALFAIAEERSWKIQSLVTPNMPSKISTFVYIKNIVLFLIWTHPRRKNIWPFEIAKCNLPQMQTASAHFSKSEVEKLKQVAQARKVSWNSLLFFTLHQAVNEIFKFDSSPKSWWIPVNMRRELGLNPNDPSLQKNYVSNFTIDVTSDQSLQDFHQLISWSLKKKKHWGTWWWQHLGKFLPESLLEKIALKNLKNNHYIGAFTNLGEWNCSEESELTFLVNTLRSHPIGAAAIIWNGQLNLGVSIYPTFQANPLVISELWQIKIRNLLDL